MSETQSTPIYSVRPYAGKWAVYVADKRVTGYYDTRQDAIFFGVRDAERRAK